MKIGEDDPRLTAYALGERLEPELRAAIEESEQLTAEAAAIRKAGALIAASLRAEAQAGLSSEQRAAVLAAAQAPSLAAAVSAGESAARRERGLRRLGLPRLRPTRRRLAMAALAIGGVAFACALTGIPRRAPVALFGWLYAVRDRDSQADIARSRPALGPIAARDALAYTLGLKSAESVGLSGELREAESGSSEAMVPEARQPAGELRLGAGERAYEGLRAGEPALAVPQPTSGAAVAGAEALGEAGLRKIVKHGSVVIEVRDVRLAVGQVTAAAVELGGYVIEAETHDYGDEGYGGARLVIAVPVNNFEALMDRIRRLALRVTEDAASGRDASQEYVDLQSQIANLEATRARVREFLDRARTVEEALRVNSQLTEIEGQISNLKGRLQYLNQSAAYSTVEVVLGQADRAPTPTPTPAAVSWQPERTARQAAGALSVVLRILGDLAIWIGIVILPLALPLAAVGYAVRRVRSRAMGAQGRTTSVTARPPQGE